MQPQDLIQRYGSPLYVYDEAVLRARARALKAAFAPHGFDVHYAMKANSNPALLRVVREEGLRIDAVSVGEVRCARRIGFPATLISYTGGNVAAAELEEVVDLGVHVTVDSLGQLERYAGRFPGTRVGVRINPDVGDGHHPHVITGGPESKFGIDESQVEDALALAARANLRIDGVHQHIGSGILDPEPWLFAVGVLLRVAARFPDLAFVDFGGGLGVPYRPLERPLDVAALAQQVAEKVRPFREQRGDELRFRIEPGRFVVAECGTLLVTVTSVKRTARHLFVGTDSGFHHLLRPVLYGAWHPIENVSNPDGPRVSARIAGNLCESGDLFAVDRDIAECREGDVLAIRQAGAYGYSMASNYNLRVRPAEVILRGDESRIIRRRETVDDLLATAEWEEPR